MSGHSAENDVAVREAADRVGAWLDTNWKYVSDDLGRDLRALVEAAQTRPAPPGQDADA